MDLVQFSKLQEQIDSKERDIQLLKTLHLDLYDDTAKAIFNYFYAFSNPKDIYEKNYKNASKIIGVEKLGISFRIDYQKEEAGSLPNLRIISNHSFNLDETLDNKLDYCLVKDWNLYGEDELNQIIFYTETLISLVNFIKTQSKLDNTIEDHIKFFNSYMSSLGLTKLTANKSK